MGQIVKITPSSIAIVDDDENIGLCFKDVLQSVEGFNVIECFANAAEALAAIPCLRPDVTLMDIRLPDLNGIECAKRLMDIDPCLKVIMMTGTHESKWINASLQAGAVAYLVKPVIGEQLLATLRFVAIHKKEAGKISTGDKPQVCLRELGEEDLPLNRRETEVLTGLAEGLLYKEISEKLGISYAAVHKYQHNLFKKLQVSNRSEAIRIWFAKRRR